MKISYTQSVACVITRISTDTATTMELNAQNQRMIDQGKVHRQDNNLGRGNHQQAVRRQVKNRCIEGQHSQGEILASAFSRGAKSILYLKHLLTTS